MGLSSAILMIESISEYSAIEDIVDKLIENQKFDTFRVTTRRHSKKFNKTSIETNVDLGSYVQKKMD